MLMVHPWADDRPARARKRRGAILRENWREKFENFARDLNDSNIYVTIDLDCLAPNLAWTNWENGKFDFEDVRWGLATLTAACSCRGWRHVRRILAAGLRAKETTVRFGIRSSKIRFSTGR